MWVGAGKRAEVVNAASCPVSNAAGMESKREPLRRYICSFAGCPAAYNRQWKLDAHLCKHTGVKPHACARCAKSFCTSYHLARHALSHSGEKPFRCPEDGCGEAFTTAANRARHVGRVHAPGRKRTYACRFEGCALEFRKNKQLKAHVCERHGPPAGHPCTHEGCAMRFAVPSKLRRHEKVHRGYPCADEGCGFTGKTWTEYLRHRKERHRPVLRCDQCDKSFRDSWFLQQHRRVHSETRVVLRCPRAGCERSFTTAFNLQSHVGSFHEERRPFACAHAGCGKTFAMKQSLRRHSVAHDPDKKKLAKARPKRSLASRLSGYGGTAAAEPGEESGPPGPVELVSLLQDTSLLCGPAVDTHGLAEALATPLAV